jgi:hypothetical protein
MATKPNILIIASVTAKPGKEAELISALREVAEPTRRRPFKGTLRCWGGASPRRAVRVLLDLGVHVIPRLRA